MTVADLMQAMADAGAPVDAIIIAVRAIEERDAEFKALEAQKTTSSGAERQKRYRQRRAERNEGDATRDVTRNDGDVTNPLPSPSPSFPPDPPNNPIPAHPRVCVSRAREANPFPMPEGIDPQHWNDFLANRKRKKLTNSTTAHKRLMDDLGRYSDDEWPPGRLIEHAAGKGWGGIYDPRESEAGPNVRSRPTVPQQPSRFELYQRTCAEAEAERGDDEDHPGTGLPLPAQLSDQRR